MLLALWKDTNLFIYVSKGILITPLLLFLSEIAQKYKSKDWLTEWPTRMNISREPISRLLHSFEYSFTHNTTLTVTEIIVGHILFGLL